MDALYLPGDDKAGCPFHPVVFDSITADVIKQAALHTKGAPGPSGVDSWSWRRFCSAFGKSSSDICHALASFCKKLCSSYIDPKLLAAYTACGLIPLDKNPGVRPIGVAEVCRRIFEKVIMVVCKDDLIAAVSPSHLCVGLDSGCEAAFHAMCMLYDDPDTQAILFVDATNAFNNLNRAATLRNVQKICPIMAPILINTYRSPSALFVNNKSLLSQEGTTQGDPLAMGMYAIGTLPLIDCLKEVNTTQVWYADDSATGGAFEDVRRWWDCLNKWGPMYGYYPNSSKTCLLVKPQLVSEAEYVFQGTGIKITCEGCEYLGGAVGCSAFMKEVGNKRSRHG